MVIAYSLRNLAQPLIIKWLRFMLIFFMSPIFAEHQPELHHQ